MGGHNIGCVFRPIGAVAIWTRGYGRISVDGAGGGVTGAAAGWVPTATRHIPLAPRPASVGIPTKHTRLNSLIRFSNAVGCGLLLP